MHPQIGDNRKLSIAVLLGSVDAHLTVYSAAVRLQQAREDVIGSLSNMVKDTPVNFYRQTVFKPRTISFCVLTRVSVFIPAPPPRLHPPGRV